MHASCPSVQNSMAFHDDLPLGYRFRPDIEQLLLQFLRPVLEGEDFPKWFVPLCDLYGDQEPWQIWDEHFKILSENDPERTDLYFITTHKKKTLKGKRTSRSVGRGGTWKGDDAAEPVLSASRDRKVIGQRKRFHYENKGSSQNGRWLMHEFELDASLLRDKRKAKDYVLCILRKKIILVEKSSDQDQEEDDEMSGEGGDDQQDGDLPEPKFLPEPELAKEQMRSTDTQESYYMRKNAMEIEVHQANKKNYNKDAQQQAEEHHLKRVKQFQAFLMKQIIADDHAKRINDHKDSQKRSLEDLENFLMSDD